MHNHNLLVHGCIALISSQNRIRICSGSVPAVIFSPMSIKLTFSGSTGCQYTGKISLGAAFGLPVRAKFAQILASRLIVNFDTIPGSSPSVNTLLNK